MAGISISVYEELLRTSEHSDFTIRCQGAEFKVHKVILGGGSDFFKALFRSECKETSENIVELPEDDPETIGRVIDFLYKGWYSTETTPVSMQKLQPSSPTAPKSSEEEPEKEESTEGKRRCFFRNSILVYQAADKFCMPKLATLASASIKLWIKLLGVDDRFGEVLELVFKVTSTEDDLRSFVVEYCIENHEKLAKDQKTVDMMKRHETVAWNVGRSLMTKLDHANQKIEKHREERKKWKNNGEAGSPVA